MKSINLMDRSQSSESSLRILGNQLGNVAFRKNEITEVFPESKRKIFTRQELTTIDNSKSREQGQQPGAREKRKQKHFNQGNFKTNKQQMVANIFLKCKHPFKFYKGKAKNKRATILEATKLKVQ